MDDKLKFAYDELAKSIRLNDKQQAEIDELKEKLRIAENKIISLRAYSNLKKPDWIKAITNG